MKFHTSGMHFKSLQEIQKAFKIKCPYIPEEISNKAIFNTNEVNEKVNIHLEKQEMILPDVGGDNPYQKLHDRSFKRLNNKGLTHYKERLDKELTVINELGFSKYFLIVSDFVDYCNQNDIRLNYGRGSAAGSMLCYALGITGIDPVKEDLIFERFINPNRVDPPDIDIDVPQSKRKQLVKYFKDKYGEKNAAAVGTVGKLQPKSAFRDVSKMYEIPYLQVNEISKLFDENKTVMENYNDNREISKLISKLPKFREIIEISDAISGTFRQSGTHAAGVVIAPDELTNYGVIEYRNNEEILCWQKDELDFFGLIKVDILGLSALDKLDDSEKLIIQRHKKIDLSLAPKEKVLEEFGRGNTIGIFQFESREMTNLLRRIKYITDKNILVDTNALVRPGPSVSGMTKKYIERHHKEINNELWKNDLPYAQHIKDITKYTKGNIIYQEQVIRVLVEVAGYTPTEADEIRRIIARKKGRELIDQHEEEFINGCRNISNMDEKIAKQLFLDLAEFESYSFNKSHSAAYTELGWLQMQLKVAYPREFMLGLFQWTKLEEKIAMFIQECERLKIEVIMPDINRSKYGVSLQDDKFVIGLDSIKGVGTKAVKAIVSKRKYGPYKNLEDLRTRIDRSSLSISGIRALVLAGACESLGVNTKAFIENEDWYNKFYEYTVLGKNKRNFDPNVPVEIYSEEQLSKSEVVLNKIETLPGIYTVSPKIGLENRDNGKLQNLCKMIKVCTACSMWKHYKKPIPPTFTDKSELFIIGEAPGEKEYKKGECFIETAPAGRNLMNQLKKLGLSREYLYLTNVYKCRPYKNKLKDPPHTCWKILKKEIEIMKPKVILSLGNTPMEFFTGKKGGIMKKSGTMSVEIINSEPIPVLYCLHPASMIYGDNEDKQEIWNSTWEFIKEKI
jgi:DNA polymerase-3 subunit alpha